ncbi:MAG: DUF6498-containing protein [Planctomycetota bacterium]|jgi:hypothetical protein
MQSARRYLTNIPLVSLVLANSLPLAGVLFLGWDAFYIVLLYWAENLVIGFYNVLKMACVKVSHPIAHIGKIFPIAFFIFHYGGFTGVHGLFVLAVFKKDVGMPMGEHTWPCFLVFVQLLLNVIKQAYSIITPNMKIALLALFLSHGVAFVHNYLLKGEFARTSTNALMSQPYSRVVVMHIAILAGSFFSLSLGSPISLLVILVILKAVIDVKMYLRQRRKTKAKGNQ